MSIEFPVSALPYCVFSTVDGPKRLGVGLESDVVDLAVLSDRISSTDPALARADRLDRLLEAGSDTWGALRSELLHLVQSGAADRARVAQRDVRFHLAWTVSDYVDFYSSRPHAENVGRIFRPGEATLPENWLHLPVAYHGRSSTVVVDGTAVRRPLGQLRTPGGSIEFGPTRQLDFELEIGYVLGGSTAIGEPVPISAASDHLFGLVLLNDWSARDIQAWEYVPLGPFLGKSFATSVSAWVMPMAALEAAMVAGPTQQPPPLPYLRTETQWGMDLSLEVWIRPSGAAEAERVTAVSAADGIYWNAAQQLAHMTVNGAKVSPGDLFGSGTVSGPLRGERGSLLELSWGGTEAIEVAGELRTFLQDGDEVTLRGSAPGPDGPIPLGPVAGAITPNPFLSRESV